MCEAAMTEVSMPEICLLDTPYEILFEIFQTLSKGKLIEISKLCSKFRLVAGDTRFWKDVYIKYKPSENYSFEKLYSEPWPVKVIDLSHTKIYPPFSLQTEQVTEIGTLNLSSVTANEVTIAAILAKYQCMEIYLDSRILEIGPEAFSKQTVLEVLSVQGLRRVPENSYEFIPLEEVHQLLAPILKYLKNLKTLDLTQVSIGNCDMPGFVKSLPTSLEKLFLRDFPKDPFFELLAERIPNLREIKASTYLKVRYQSLLNFQFLEALHFFYSLFHDHIIRSGNRDNISDVYKYLIKFPALKTVHITVDYLRPDEHPKIFPGKLQTMLQPHGIIVRITKKDLLRLHSKDEHLWEVN